MKDVRVAVVGVGNCANCLIQGSEYLKNADPIPDDIGLLTRTVAGYGPDSVSVVCGFDVDERKVGKDLSEAMWAEPNVADDFFAPESDLGPVYRGPLLDGLGRSHEQKVTPSSERAPGRRDIAQILDDHGVDVLVNFLPVGADQASREYALAALEAGAAFVNAIPVWIAGDEELRKEFAESRIPLIGDDVKSQVGATILHRALVEAFQNRGAKILDTYQLNFGGNTDFWNMKDEERLETKRQSKTAAVTSMAEIPPGAVHIGPSGFIGFLRDKKIAFIRVEGTGFCGNQLEVELRYSGQDSPNSAAVVYDAVRFAAAAKELPDEIPLDFFTMPVSAWLMKAPPQQIPDADAAERCRSLAVYSPAAYVLDGDEIRIDKAVASAD